MTLFSVFWIAVLRRPRVTTTAIVMTPSTTAYSAIVWPLSSWISVMNSRMWCLLDGTLPGGEPFRALLHGASRNARRQEDAGLEGVSKTRFSERGGTRNYPKEGNRSAQIRVPQAAELCCKAVAPPVGDLRNDADGRLELDHVEVVAEDRVLEPELAAAAQMGERAEGRL